MKMNQSALAQTREVHPLSGEYQSNNTSSAEYLSPEVALILELCPNLDQSVIYEILKGNNFDVDKSADAALALAVSLAAEEGTPVLGRNSNASNTAPNTSHNTQSSPAPFRPSSNANASRSRRESMSFIPDDVSPVYVSRRGHPIILNDAFLAAPKFRLVVEKHTPIASEFTVAFRREREKLGITIHDVDGDICIHSLHRKDDHEHAEPLLAMQAGVHVGDVLTGINNEYFSPGVEVQDVIDILHLAGSYVTLHFTRRYRDDSTLCPYHKYAQMLVDQSVIPKEKASSTTKSLCRLKDRVLQWDSGWISQRINSWKLDRGVVQEPQKLTPNDVLVPTHNLRPALSVRLLRAEQRTDHIVYVVWVMDVRSGAEWVVYRRFREFYDFRDLIASVRPGIARLDFPPKRLNVTETSSMISERIFLLQKFLRKISSLVCVNSLHPSTAKVQIALQHFLCVGDRLESIELMEKRPEFAVRTMIQVFVHSVTQMGVMDRILNGYTENFLEDSEEDPRGQWDESRGRRVLTNMKDFIDNLQGVIFEGLCDDCTDIIEKLEALAHEGKRSATSIYRYQYQEDTMKIADSRLQKYRVFPQDVHTMKNTTTIITGGGIDSGGASAGKGSRMPSQDASGTRESDLELMPLRGSPVSSRKSTADYSEHDAVADEFDESLEKVGGGCEEKSNGNTTSNGKSLKEIHRITKARCTHDEMRLTARSAVRRQVEIEIYVPCAAKLRSILEKCFAEQEGVLNEKLKELVYQPQMFFGVALQYISPSCWDAAVFRLRQIRSKTLPHDRLGILTEVCKMIPQLFIQEHPEATNPLGADDFLPIFIYVLVRAQIPKLLSLCEELQAFCDPDQRMSESGYYLATLEASLYHLFEADVELGVLFPVQLNKDDDDDLMDSLDDGDADQIDPVSHESFSDDPKPTKPVLERQPSPGPMGMSLSHTNAHNSSGKVAVSSSSSSGRAISPRRGGASPMRMRVDPADFNMKQPTTVQRDQVKIVAEEEEDLTQKLPDIASLVVDMPSGAITGEGKKPALIGSMDEEEGEMKDYEVPEGVDGYPM